MIHISHCIFVMFIGLSIVVAKNDVIYRNMYQKRPLRNNEQIRHLRNLVGKLVDTDTNVVYNIDGQKFEDSAKNSVTTPAPPLKPAMPPSSEEIACLAACHSCVEDYPAEKQKKDSDANCGPMCDCADSCFRMPAQEVGKIYGHNAKTDYGKECWWRVFTDAINI